MISAGGSIFNTLPVTYLTKDLVYRPTATGEVVWGDAIQDVGENYEPVWESASDPVIHGAWNQPYPSEEPSSPAAWWFTKGFLESRIWGTGLDAPQNGKYVQVEEVPSVTGGLDDLVIFRMMDGIRQMTPDEVQAAGGNIGDFGATVLDDSYAVAVDTGFMDEDPQTRKTLIMRLEAITDAVDVYVSGDALGLL